MISVKAAASKGRKLPPHMQNKKKGPTVVKPEDIQDEDDGGHAVERPRRRRSQSERDTEGIELPSYIKVKATDGLHQIPNHVLNGRSFKWDPQAFVIENERLKDKLIESDVQDASLKRWIDDPTLPVVYGVSGSPDDVQARYMAAYLAQVHVQRVGHTNARVVWHSLYGGYRNDLLDDYKDAGSAYLPTLLVLTNLAQGSTPQKLEKAKDLIERFSTIPRIIVSAGEDPLSFLSVRLNCQCNGLAYFAADLMRKRVEII